VKKKTSGTAYAMNIKPMFYYTAAFITGLFIMALEMLGFRLLAPYFGYSTYIWGSLIGIIMTALAIGYFLGGSIADRFPRPELLFSSIFLAGLYTGIITFIYKKILLFSQGFGLIGGSIAATVLLFAFPMLLLSTVSPFMIRLLAEEKRIGTTAGKIYSISTAGSIIGTFFASFYLIPALGSHKSLIICAVFLLCTGIAGLLAYKKESALLVFLILPFIFNYAGPPPAKKIIFSKESPYSHVEVETQGKWLWLKPENNFIYSIYHPERIVTGYYWDYYCIAPIIQNKAGNCLVLGMGGGTSVRQFLHFWPDLNIDALDIDPVVVNVATSMFGIPQNAPNLNIIIEDARTYLQKTEKKKYDFIQIDLFRGGVSIPFYLATKEFFELCQDRLKPGGLIIMNVNALQKNDAEGPTLSGCIGNTISEVFPSVYNIDLATGNSVFLAFSDKKTEADLLRDLKGSDAIPQELQEMVNMVSSNFEPYLADSDSYVLTDDHAPLDELAFPVAVAAFKKNSNI
jgi:MFS family permease